MPQLVQTSEPTSGAHSVGWLHCLHRPAIVVHGEGTGVGRGGHRTACAGGVHGVLLGVGGTRPAGSSGQVEMD